MKKIKVLVVDDSALMRKIISDLINSEIDMEVVEVAKNGQDLLDKVHKSQPEVITMDVEMPQMNGIEALKELRKANSNIPVIMLSSISKRGTIRTMECLEAGAFDFIAKPSGTISLDINKVKDDLVEKIRLAYSKSSYKEILNSSKNEISADINRLKNNASKNNFEDKIEAIVIGASTGGPKALYTVITSLPENLGIPILIVQHMPAGFTKAFADRLNTNSKLTVKEAIHGEIIEKNVTYIAPGGYHMEVGNEKKICLNQEPTIWGVRPAVDKLFISASKVYGSRLISIVLTGMGKDGAQGTIEVKKNGGHTASEDKSTCTIYGMPKTAFETGMVDQVLLINEFANYIIKAVKS